MFSWTPPTKKQFSTRILETRCWDPVPGAVVRVILGIKRVQRGCVFFLNFFIFLCLASPKPKVEEKRFKEQIKQCVGALAYYATCSSKSIWALLTNAEAFFRGVTGHAKKNTPAHESTCSIAAVVSCSISPTSRSWLVLHQSLGQHRKPVQHFYWTWRSLHKHLPNS